MNIKLNTISTFFFQTNKNLRLMKQNRANVNLLEINSNNYLRQKNPIQKYIDR